MDALSTSVHLPKAEDWAAADVLEWGYRRFGGGLAIASAFGLEGIVLIDLAWRIRRDVRVFTLDTGFFFP